MSEYIYRVDKDINGVNVFLLKGEIVRCKDCKWRDEPGCAIRIVDDSDRPEDDDYCSFGERKTE